MAAARDVHILFRVFYSALFWLQGAFPHRFKRGGVPKAGAECVVGRGRREDTHSDAGTFGGQL